MGVRVHPEVKTKLHDLESFSFSHYKKIKNLAPPPKRKKIMVTVFWDCEDLQCEFPPTKTTINSDKYCETFEKSCEAFKRERPG
jgi:hypothetical protein